MNENLQPMKIKKFGWIRSLPNLYDPAYLPPLRLTILPTTVDLRPQCPPVYDQKELEIISNNFIINDCTWLVNGCNHTRDSGNTYHQQMVPTWNENILTGVNTISSPSVLSFKKEVELLFDEKLVMLMDCDFYYSLYKKFGLPLFLEECLVTNRFHEHQISSLYDSSNFSQEINYVKNKHKVC